MSEEKKISREELESLLEDVQEGPQKNSWFSLAALPALCQSGVQGVGPLHGEG